MSHEGVAVEHLFRREAGRLTAILVRIFGLHNLDLAEEAVAETLCRALEVWKFRGIPENPSAWLTRAARNRAIDMIRRERTARRFAPDLSDYFESEWTLSATVDAHLLGHEVKDEQLRMMLACCHPQIGEDGQVMLILKLLSGFSVEEVAQAFLLSEAAVEKRITRGKKLLVESASGFSPGPHAIEKRLDAIHTALYLLFNEGYHSSHPSHAVRRDLCAEAIRLGELLADHPEGATGATFALLGLMCFHAARLPSRTDENGGLVLLEQQDRSLWDRRLLTTGFGYMARSSGGEQLSAFHLEAAIAAHHSYARSFAATDWAAIKGLYDALFELRPSPIVALNRAIVIGQLDGPDAGLAAIEAIDGREQLESYRLFPAVLADLHRRAGRSAEARQWLERAKSRTTSRAELDLIDAKLESL